MLKEQLIVPGDYKLLWPADAILIEISGSTS
jgi:hypothetical protein